MIDILSVAIGAFFGALGKEVFDNMKLSLCGRRYYVQCRINELRKTSLIDTKGVCVVPFNTIEVCIDDALEDEDGGVWIFGAPAGYGKTTYLAHQIETFRMKFPKREVIVFPNGTSVLNNKKISQVLGVPENEPLSRYIPDGSIIVLDQFDIGESLSEDTKEYIRDLATDSRNSKKYSVIISVSNYQTMFDLLSINGGEKVKDICHPNFIQWTDTEVAHYINKMFNDWTDNNKHRLIESCESARSPGVLFDVYKMKQSGRHSVDDIIKSTKYNIKTN
jgi:hypothetical protein